MESAHLIGLILVSIATESLVLEKTMEPSTYMQVEMVLEAPPGGGGGGPDLGCGFGPGDGGPYHCHAIGNNPGDNLKIIRAGGFGLTDFDNMSTIII